MFWTLIVWSLLSLSYCFGGNYNEYNDKTVVPIVLSICGIIMLFCVIGCCNQGKACCNKNKSVEENTSGHSYFRTERKTKIRRNERSGEAYRQSALPVRVTFKNEAPPLYSIYKSGMGFNDKSGYAGRNGFDSKQTPLNNYR